MNYLHLYLHKTRKCFVKSPLQGSQIVLADFYREERVAIALHVVDDDDTSAFGTLTQLDMAAYTARVGIGAPGSTPLASETLTWDAGFSAFLGVLNLNTTQMGTAFGEGVLKLSKTFEAEVKLGSTAETTAQADCKVRNELLTASSGTPEDVTDSLFVDRVVSRISHDDSIRIQRTDDILDFSAYCYGDAKFDDTLRLEIAAGAPGTYGCPVDPTSGSKSVTVQAFAAHRQMLKLRVLGRVELRPYSNGTSLGHVNISDGGVPGISSADKWWITVSSPAQTYYLNNDPSPTTGNMVELDYLLSVPADPGATVTLHFDSLDGLTNSYGDGADPVIEGVSPSPDPFIGEFIEIQLANEASVQPRFVDLVGAPATLLGQGLKVVRVKSDGSGLELVTVAEVSIGAPGYGGTSVTSFAVASSGSKAFTTQAGLAYQVGARVRATSAADTANWMEGVVTSYSGTTLTITADKSNGSGTHTDWNLNLAGEPGATGADGAGYGGTSVTSFAVASSGSKAFTTQAGLAYQAGARVRATSAADTANWMEGVVTSYSGTALTITADKSNGGGTHADWNLNLAGEPGEAGGGGGTGPAGSGYGGTSTTSFAVASSGSKAFTTQAGLAYQAGARVRATSAADTANWMEGVVTSYSGTTLTITADKSNGSGTHTDWNLNLAGEPGAAGGGGSSTPSVWKEACVVRTTAPITRSGSQTVNGVAVSSPMRVLDIHAATTTERGIYVVNNSGAWVRSDDCQPADLVAGMAVPVSGGTVGAGQIYVLNLDAVTWSALAGTTAGRWKAIRSSSDGSKILLYGTGAGGTGIKCLRSADSGATWSDITPTIGGHSLDASAASSVWMSRDGTKIALPGAGGIAISEDSGATFTWSAAPGGAGEINGLCGADDGTVLYATQRDTSTSEEWWAYKLTPASSWASRAASRDWRPIAMSSDGVKMVATVFGGQLWTSADTGATWTARDSARDWLCCASSADGTKLVAGVHAGVIYTSTDSGVTWTAQSSGTAQWCSLASSADGTKLVACAFTGEVIVSTDSGATWTDVTGGTYGAGVRAWRFVTCSSDGSKIALADHGGTLWNSTDSGTTWAAMGPNLGYDSVAMSADGTKLIAGAIGTGHVYTSSDSGATWTERSGPGAATWYSVSISGDGNTLCATPYSGYINISTDGGATWTAQTAAGSRGWYEGAVSSDGGIIAAAGFAAGNIYVFAPDGSKTWTSVIHDATNTLFGVQCSADGTQLVLGSSASSGEVRFSADSGATFSTSAIGATVEHAISDDGQVIVASLASGTTVKVSTNGGTSFASRTGFTTAQGVAVTGAGTKVVVADYGAQSVSLSTDSGATFTAVPIAGYPGAAAVSNDGAVGLTADASSHESGAFSGGFSATTTHTYHTELIHRSSVAGSAVTGVTETTVATLTLPPLGANAEVLFGAVFTRPSGQAADTLLNIELNGSPIAVHKLDISTLTVIPLQHLFSNRNSTGSQLGGCDAAGALLIGAVDTTAASTLVFKLLNGDAGDAATLESLTVRQIRG